MYIWKKLNKKMYSKKSLLSAFILGGIFTIFSVDIMIANSDEFKLIRFIKPE